MTHSSPALVSQTEVPLLPRWTLWLLCVCYVLAGFVGREPWKNADVAAFGVMQAMAQGTSSWLQPSLLGTPADTPGLLPYWLGAWAIQLLPSQSVMFSRLPFVVVLGLTLALTWHAVFRFALLPRAQPVTFAFGGQANPLDYARALADAGLLGLMACLGLAQLAHEATPDLFALAGFSAAMYGIAGMVSSGQTAQTKGGLAWLAGLVVLGLSGQAIAALGLSATLPLICWAWAFPPKSTSTAPPNHARLVIGLMGLMISGLLLALAPTNWPSAPSWELLNLAAWSAFGRFVLWFAWPAWPLAMWTLWRWRKQWRQPHIGAPLAFVGAALALSWAHGQSDRHLLFGLPALAVLAAFSLPTLKRSVAALVDWFSVLFFTGGAVVIWVIWIAMVTGVPAQPAANVARLAPGFVAHFNAWTFGLASLASLAWLMVVAWRVGRHQSALWKSMVLPATGGVLCWVLLMTLWMPLLDFGRSYGPLSRRMATLVPQGACVEVFGLSQAQMAGLAYLGRMDLRRPKPDSTCKALVTTPQAAPQWSQTVQLNDWAFRARLSRLTDNKESLVLYQRVALRTSGEAVGEAQLQAGAHGPTETPK